MGEYATYNGQEVKIGTCEDLYYLRADQLGKIRGVPAGLLEWGRFRFPFPDEDNTEPGAFETFNRSIQLDGMAAPTEMAGEHYSVQFVAQAGYNVCLPCPEAGAAEHGLTVHRNGFSGAVKLVQQRFVDGQLVAIVQCGGCGLAWRLPTIHEAEPAIESLLAEAQRREDDA